MSKQQEKPKPILQSCNIAFPGRVWELGENGWTSRPVTADDLVSRRAVAEALSAVMI